MYGAGSDPLIWEVHPAKERYKEPNFREYFDGAIQSGSAFSILDRGSGAIIGSSRYHGFNPELREIEIGWTFLSRSVWGGAYNREIKGMMIDHAFGFADCVLFWIGETNIRSRRAVEKIGGQLRDGIFVRTHQGVDHPYVSYEIRKSNWRK
mgnify:CR=1 FL=1